MTMYNYMLGMVFGEVDISYNEDRVKINFCMCGWPFTAEMMMLLHLGFHVFCSF